MSKKEEKPIEVIFAPGCFDDFDGTQEELDAMIKEITEMFASGNIDPSKVTPVEDMSDEEIEELLGHMDDKDGPRVLQ